MKSVHLITTEYFKKQADRLHSDYLGSVVENHAGDTGTNRDKLLKEWLKLHIPKTITPEMGGQIIDGSGMKTKQVDLILYSSELPRFGAFEKSYYFAEGVSSAIQVKSKLGSSELKDAIDNLITVKKCVVDTPALTFGEMRTDIPSGIFAFESGFSTVDNLVTALNKHFSTTQINIDFICINKFCYVVYNRGEWSNQDKSGNQTMIEKGYFIVAREYDSLWRFVLDLSRFATSKIGANYNFQKYFMPTPVIPPAQKK